jgi:hypothetical protein
LLFSTAAENTIVHLLARVLPDQMATIEWIDYVFGVGMTVLWFFLHFLILAFTAIGFFRPNWSSVVKHSIAVTS